MTADLKRATQIATEAHEGQTRFNGNPYVEHPLRVSGILKVQGYSERVQIVGVLHDVVEDTKLTFEDLREEGFGDDIVVPLELLTKGLEVGYESYIQRLAVNACARVVKKADIFDNFSLDRPNPSMRDAMRLERYGRAMLYLARFPPSLL